MMNVKISDLGALKQADISINEMTIICGRNNTGKTYATYALYGFLAFWRGGFSIDVEEGKVTRLLSEGSVTINLRSYIEAAANIIDRGCEAYVGRLPNVFATAPGRFSESKFSVTLDSDEIGVTGPYERRSQSAKADLFVITKSKDSNELVITLLIDKEKIKIPRRIIGDIIGDSIKEIIFGHLFCRPFIASAERTGAAIFRRELNFARNRLLEEVSKADKSINTFELLTKEFQDYPLPVKANVEFTRELESINKTDSFLKEKHPEILVAFGDLVGGEYLVTRNDELYFVPTGKGVRLTMDESSSAVRSLLDIGFYIRHIAQPGDLLMIDEPELNLHPENQRRVARLLARLVNVGIKVFITTHSDYIIKELNTLIMLNQPHAHHRKIMNREGYAPQELLDISKINVYIAEEVLGLQPGKVRRSKWNTTTKADINPVTGIQARSFDETILEMNRIQEEITWPSDE